MWEGGSGRGKCKGGGAGEVGKLRQNQGAQLARIPVIIKVGTVRYFYRHHHHHHHRSPRDDVKKLLPLVSPLLGTSVTTRSMLLPLLAYKFDQIIFAMPIITISLAWYRTLYQSFYRRINYMHIVITIILFFPNAKA